MSAAVALLAVLLVGRAAGPLAETVLARRRVRRLSRRLPPLQPPELEAITNGIRSLLPQVRRVRRVRRVGWVGAVRREVSVERELPEALEAIGRSLRSGATVAAAVGEAASAVTGPLAGDLRLVASRAPLQGAVPALESWARERDEPAVRLAVAALVLGLESGGAPGRAVDGVAAGVRARRALAAEVRALSSQARLSAGVIGAAPLAFGALASATDAGVARVLFGTRLGALLLVSGLGLDAVGALWMMRLCRPPSGAGRGRGQAAVDDEVPEVIDLFAVALRAGLTVRLAVAAVAPRARGRLGAELGHAIRQCERGRLLADALAEVPERVGDGVRPLVAALVDADRYGAPLGPALERLAGEARDQRRRRAEERARRIPVLLLFPLVLCVLPAFALLTVAPLLAGALDALDGLST